MVIIDKYTYLKNQTMSSVFDLFIIDPISRSSFRVLEMSTHKIQKLALMICTNFCSPNLNFQNQTDINLSSIKIEKHSDWYFLIVHSLYFSLFLEP